MRAIVGLGNPGSRYAHTRHNVGFMLLERLAERWKITFDREKYQARIAAVQVAGETLWLVQPQTYMNESGRAVAPILRRHVHDTQKLLIVYDDIDLPLGRLRLRARGSAGTHRGLASVLTATGTQEIPRLRLGIGPKPEGVDLADYVLSTFTPEEKPKVEEMLRRAEEIVILWLEQTLEAAMNVCNR